MKRYLVFGLTQYYPGGGWNDFVGASETREGAQAIADEHASKPGRDEYYNIIDLVEKGILSEIETAPLPKE